MQTNLRITAPALLIGLAIAPATRAQTVTDDFNADTSTNYSIVSNGVSATTFAFDYSALGIPAAPNTTDSTTLGLKMEANMDPTQGASAAVTLHTNQSFAGDRVITFDAWMNANGPFPVGGGGSTEFLTAGVGGDGVTVNEGGTTGVGAWFAPTGEGGSSRDYRAYKDANEQFVASGQYCAPSNNASDPYYAQFGSVDVGNLPVQGANNGGPAQQTGVSGAGSFGFGWHEVTIIINADGGTAGAPLTTWLIDGLAIAQVDAGIGSAYVSDGSVTIGYMDIFSSVSDNATLSFGLVDNLRIAPPQPAPLQMTEICVTPTAGEFIEIFNPTPSVIDLTDYYLSDATFAGGSTYYWQLTIGGGGGGGFGDFYARFPAGATIAPGEYQTIAMGSLSSGGAVGFNATYGVNPTYELYDTDATVPDMLEATTGSINGQGGLTNSGEMCVLLYWDGASDLVTDCDYAVWGDKVEAVDKTGVTVGTSTYQNDTPIANQDVVAGASGSHAGGNSWQRQTHSEGLENPFGGNGASGADETSENASFTWVEALPTPNAGTPGAVALVMSPDSGVGAIQIDIAGGTPNGPAVLAAAIAPAFLPLSFCPGEALGIDLNLGFAVAFTLDGNGALSLNIPSVPRCGVTVYMQTFDALACRASNVVVNNW